MKTFKYTADDIRVGLFRSWRLEFSEKKEEEGVAWRCVAKWLGAVENRKYVEIIVMKSKAIKSWGGKGRRSHLHFCH